MNQYGMATAQLRHPSGPVTKWKPAKRHSIRGSSPKMQSHSTTSRLPGPLNPSPTVPGTPPGACASLLGMASLHSGQAHAAVVRASVSRAAKIEVSLRMASILRDDGGIENLQHHKNQHAGDRDVEPDRKRQPGDALVR